MCWLLFRPIEDSTTGVADCAESVLCLQANKDCEVKLLPTADPEVMKVTCACK